MVVGDPHSLLVKERRAASGPERRSPGRCTVTVTFGVALLGQGGCAALSAELEGARSLESVEQGPGRWLPLAGELPSRSRRGKWLSELLLDTCPRRILA